MRYKLLILETLCPGVRATVAQVCHLLILSVLFAWAYIRAHRKARAGISLDRETRTAGLSERDGWLLFTVA